ncbi:MAG: PqqD family peptide modification chaperone [Bacillota bacterium]
MARGYSIHPSIITREEEEGTLLFNKDTDDIKLLNQVGFLIWKHCDGAHTIDQIVETLAIQYPEVPMDTLRSDVKSFLEILLSRKLLVPAEVRIEND